MFLRKLTVIVLPLAMLLAICLLIPVLPAHWYFGGLLVGLLMGISLAMLLPLAGATRLREPFAWLLFIPAVLILLILLYQYLASVPESTWGTVPVLNLFDVMPLASSGARGLIVAAESAFAAYMLTFSLRTGKGI